MNRNDKDPSGYRALGSSAVQKHISLCDAKGSHWVSLWETLWVNFKCNLKGWAELSFQISNSLFVKHCLVWPTWSRNWYCVTFMNTCSIVSKCLAMLYGLLLPHCRLDCPCRVTWGTMQPVHLRTAYQHPVDAYLLYQRHSKAPEWSPSQLPTPCIVYSYFEW